MVAEGQATVQKNEVENVAVANAFACMSSHHAAPALIRFNYDAHAKTFWSRSTYPLPS